MTVEDEIALLASDIRRWAGQDARIHEALEQLIKLYEAEVNALAFEAMALQRDRIEDVPHCQICLEDSLLSVCDRCEAKGGLYGEWRDFA